MMRDTDRPVMAAQPTPPTLLPNGLQDVLPPHAWHDRWITNTLLDRFFLFGYEQVATPLLEFEETLLSGKGQAHARNSFRVMDPASQRMMGLRPDMTPQMERVARTMLSPARSQVRLAYAGQVLRVSPSSLSTQRQLRQAGLELIGYEEAVSQVEVITASVEALEQLGLRRLVISLSCAGLLDEMLRGCLAESREGILKAVYNKDLGSLPAQMPYREAIKALLSDPLAEVVERHDLPEPFKCRLDELLALKATLEAQFGEVLEVHPDPLDTDGFDYHEGICFTLLEPQSRQEIGRGGNYSFGEDRIGCGMSLYVDCLLTAPLAWPQAPQTVTLAQDAPYTEGRALRDAGKATASFVGSK